MALALNIVLRLWHCVLLYQDDPHLNCSVISTWLFPGASFLQNFVGTLAKTAAAIVYPRPLSVVGMQPAKLHCYSL